MSSNPIPIDKVEEWTKGRFIAIAGPFLGSMGQVYKATDTFTRKNVAVKFPLDDDLVKWVAASKTIEREAEVLERFEKLWDGLPASDPRRKVIGDLLCHPVSAGWAILSDPEKKGRYLAMDWAEGTSLFNLINTSGPRKTLPLGSVLRILSDVASLLAAAHSLGFSNNDVDAKQIYWDERGGKADGMPKPYLKVIDWANAEIFDPQSQSPKPRKDIVQFGGLMFSLLTGATDQKIEISNGAQLRERLSRSAIDVSEALEQILAKTLEIEGGYSNAQELADDLTECLEEYQKEQNGKLARATGLIQKSEFDKAREIIAEVQRDDPANEHSAEDATHLVRSQKNQELQGLMQAARGSLEIGKWELARKYLLRAKKSAENREDIDEIDRQLGAVDLMTGSVEDADVLKYRRSAINGYLQNNLSEYEILDQLLLGNVFGIDNEDARSNAFVLHIRKKTSSHFLREDLGDLANSLIEDTQKRPDASSRRKTVNKIETAVKNLPTVEERDIKEQKKWYFELKAELEESAGQLEGLSDGSVQKRNVATKLVEVLLGILDKADGSGLECKFQEAQGQYLDCLRRDPVNRFFFDQWALLGKLEKINEELRASLVKSPRERGPIVQNLKDKLNVLSEEYSSNPYIEAMRKKVNDQEKFDLEYGFELLAKGQFGPATEFVKDAKKRIGGGDKKLDCLDALIKGVRHLFHRREYQDTKEGESSHLKQAQECAEEAGRKAGERRESGVLLQVISVYQELRDDKKSLKDRLAQANKTIEEIEPSFRDLNFAQLLIKPLKEDVAQIETWTDEFYRAREAFWNLRWEEAQRGFENALKTIPPRLEGIYAHTWIPSAIQVMSQAQNGGTELWRGNYAEAERAFLAAQKQYPAEFKNDPRYEKFRTYVERALQVAQTPKQIQGLAKQIANTKAPGWGVKTFDYVMNQLEALAALEQEFVEHPQSTRYLERHKRVMEYIKEHYNEKEGRHGLITLLGEVTSVKSRPE